MATNAFNRTCGRKTPRAGGRLLRSSPHCRENQPAPGPRGALAINNWRLSKARHKPQVRHVPARSANTRAASCLPGGTAAPASPKTRAEAPALEKLRPHCLGTGSVNDTMYSTYSKNKRQIMKSREHSQPTVTSRPKGACVHAAKVPERCPWVQTTSLTCDGVYSRRFLRNRQQAFVTGP